jgi:hypothetical protein
MAEKFEFDFVEHMGYYIPRTDVEGFDPETYFDGPILDERGLCGDVRCQKLGYCRNKAKKKVRGKAKQIIDKDQIVLPFK